MSVCMKRSYPCEWLSCALTLDSSRAGGLRFTDPARNRWPCVFIHFPFCPYLHPGAALWGLLNDRMSLNALTHATTRIQNVWHLWVCPLKISFRMVFIFNVAPILGVRCKQNVDERNPSLSLPSCLCRVMRPLHNLSTWKQSNAGTASVRLIKINSWFNTAPFKALQQFSKSDQTYLNLTWKLRLKWKMLQKKSCFSCMQQRTNSARLICAQITIMNWLFFISHWQYTCKSLAIYSLVS